MKTFKSIFIAGVTGVVVGSVVSLLYAPDSGDATRKKLSKQGKKAKKDVDKLKKDMQTVRSDLENILEKGKKAFDN